MRRMSYRNTVTIREYRFIFSNINGKVKVTVKLENNDLIEYFYPDLDVQKAFRKLAKKYRIHYTSSFKKDLSNYHLRIWLLFQSSKVILTAIAENAGDQAKNGFSGKLFKRNADIVRSIVLRLIASLPQPFLQEDIERLNHALKVFFKA
jgi:hypothetical protein